MSALAAPAETIHYARTQFCDALWADPALQVFAVVLGDSVPDLAQRLQPLREWDCLRPGSLEPDERREAPHLLRLESDSPLRDWLLFDAYSQFGEWGLLCLSPLPFLQLRGAMRDWCDAMSSQGERFVLDWTRPALLRALLPTLDAQQAAVFAAAAAAFVLADEQGWIWWRAGAGGFAPSRVQVLG